MKLLDKILHKDQDHIAVMMAQAAVGDMFKTWIKSDIGKYIIGRAERYETDVLKELGETNPVRILKIIRLQTESRMPGKLIQWIEEVMQDGEVAKFQLAEIEAESDD